MKNIFFWGTLALSLACLSGEQASAWINSQFGVGLNWAWTSGGNSYFWGLVREGQPGGPDICCGVQAVPAYPQPNACAPSYAPSYPCSTAPVAPVYPQAPIPVPAVAPVSAPAATAPASSTQSLYRPYGYGYYYYQPRR